MRLLARATVARQVFAQARGGCRREAALGLAIRQQAAHRPKLAHIHAIYRHDRDAAERIFGA